MGLVEKIFEEITSDDIERPSTESPEPVIELEPDEELTKNEMHGIIIDMMEVENVTEEESILLDAMARIYQDDNCVLTQEAMQENLYSLHEFAGIDYNDEEEDDIENDDENMGVDEEEIGGVEGEFGEEYDFDENLQEIKKIKIRGGKKIKVNVGRNASGKKIKASTIRKMKMAKKKGKAKFRAKLKKASRRANIKRKKTMKKFKSFISARKK